MVLGLAVLLVGACRDGAGPHRAPVFTQVSTGETASCAVAAGGMAYCWGYNGFGQLGTGSMKGPELCAGKFPCSTRPVAVSGGLTFTDVTAGLNSTACGVTKTGTAYCWGNNYIGQSGSGDTVTHSQPVQVTGGLSFAVVKPSASHTCGLTTLGAAYCWGFNHRGQLGTGDTISSYVPRPVAGGLTFASLSVGLDDACGVTPAGAAYCWGHNAWGELGNGTNTNSSTPALVSGGLRFAVVSTGLIHTCGVTTAGAAYCWGSDFAGEQGTGHYSDTSFSNTPVPVAGGLSFATISAGWWYTCGVTTTGAAYCWGWNAFGQGGLGGIGYSTPTPTAVLGGLVFAAVSASEYNTCGLTTDGAAYCWGFNSNGDLGDGSTQFSSVPVRVAGP
jgi:alpha-tubulin suppressor-like RCC1 family protein